MVASHQRLRAVPLWSPPYPFGVTNRLLSADVSTERGTCKPGGRAKNAELVLPSVS